MFETTVAAHTTEKIGCSNGAHAEIAGGACALGDDPGEANVFFHSQRARAISTQAAQLRRNANFSSVPAQSFATQGRQVYSRRTPSLKPAAQVRCASAFGPGAVMALGVLKFITT
jgi:hypothetical protein